VNEDERHESNLPLRPLVEARPAYSRRVEAGEATQPDVSAAVVEALRSVYDPCCREQGISVVDMGLIDSVRFADGEARLELVLTSGWCPFAVELLGAVRERVEALPEVEGVTVELVWDKAWGSERLSPDARAKLRFLPDPAEIRDREQYVAARVQPQERRP
jgi:metal-sulfur cluster biosynthetic enzyme